MAADEDQQWRVTFARILLGISMLFYLLILAAMPTREMTSQATQGLAVVSTLIALSAFAAIALNRMRRASIAAIALLALFTIGAFIRSAFYIRLPLPHPRTGLEIVEIVSILVTVASIGLPILVFVVTWPLRKTPVRLVEPRSHSGEPST